MTIAEVARRAREAGTSYGKYVTTLSKERPPERKQIPKRMCVWCGGDIIWGSANKKYCSYQCKLDRDRQIRLIKKAIGEGVL